jgi:signal peptidase I
MSIEQRGARLAESPTETEGTRARGVETETDGARETKEGEQAVQGPRRTIFREYFESLVVTAVMALFGMTFIVQAVKVPTGSMQNTILIGDHLLVNKFIFAPGPVMPFLPQREIRRGDIIVFKYPGKFASEQFREKNVSDTVPFKTNYVKRVIGLPGEHVEIKGTDVYINGQLLVEHKVAALNPPGADDPATSGDERGAPLRDESGEALIEANAPPRPEGDGYVVYWKPNTLKGARRLSDEETVFDIPEGHYLVLGDNRENSEDSRYWGFVPRQLVIGRAMFVYWSYDESAPHAGGRLGFLYDFFANTRWRRTGTLVK